MLSVESRTSDLKVEKHLRTPLLEALQDKGLVPQIRASRLHLFEQALGGTDRAPELERLIAERSDAEGEAPYVPGDIFLVEETIHFIIFGDDAEGDSLRAGVIYDGAAEEPSARLESFCQSVQEALDAAFRRSRDASRADADAGVRDAPRIEWKRRGAQGRDTISRFATDGAVGDSAPVARGISAAERMRAGDVLDDAAARSFLQRLSEAHADGRAAEMFASSATEPERDAIVARLAGAGLVRREVQVSCRKDGRSLFRLPSADALAIVTASNAVCSECGAAVADERAEELVTPTPLASSLVKDGAWLLGSMKATLAGLGVPEREIVTRAATDGGAQMLANVSGEPFLFVLSDGDFTAAQARRALDAEAETGATHLVVVSTGKIQDEARSRLREHARRRSRGGGGAEVVFIEGLETAAAELGRSIERVAHDALSRELYDLDAAVGFNVGFMLAERFRLTRRGGAQDLAATAAGASVFPSRES